MTHSSLKELELLTAISTTKVKNISLLFIIFDVVMYFVFIDHDK